MSDSYFGMMDLAIAGIPALAFGIWQLVSINREIARDKVKAQERSPSSSPSPEGSGHAIGEHRLDDG
jgi:hypothetical protein